MARTQSPDTSATIEQKLMAAYRSMDAPKKLKIVSELSSAAFDLAAAGIRLTSPSATDEDVCLILAARRLGREIVLRATGRRALPGE